MSMMHNLQQHAKRILAYTSRPRFFCSYRTRTLSSPTNRTLQIRIETAADNKAAITTVLEQWQQQQLGYHLNPSLVRCSVEELHDSKSFLKALELSEWMIDKKICNHLPEDYTVRFHLIENVLGLEEAKKFFESIPENLKGESIYSTALLKSDTNSGKKSLSKAESTFDKMKKLGMLLRTSQYNLMISLYSSLGIREEIYGDWEPQGLEFDTGIPGLLISRYNEEDDEAKVREVEYSSRQSGCG
ncbi:unnamed protein product [Arabidopsis arenosa]|uniref:Pentatricopeptide repeat-containing protein n=1 Tax=Arabidopsis arenosa TaxID=38785 RepID=A0A8S2ALL6_ARAAE|nr:unnamed protein product [Arabidopsis arenosa]